MIVPICIPEDAAELAAKRQYFLHENIVRI